jgi:putative flippase GtrA
VTTALTQTIIFTCFVVLSNLGVFYLLAQLLGIGAAFVINYYVSSTYIWAESKLRAVAV